MLRWRMELCGDYNMEFVLIVGEIVIELLGAIAEKTVKRKRKNKVR